MDKLITRKEAWKLLRSTRGRIFTAGFVRRTDSRNSDQKAGDVRVMNCRTGVTKHLKGGSLAFEPNSKGLFTVFDMQVEDYRFVNMNDLLWVKFRGNHYEVRG